MENLLIYTLEKFLGKAHRHDEDKGQASFDCPACSGYIGKLDAYGGVGGDGKGNLEINYKRNIFKCWKCSDVNNMHGVIMKLLKRYATSRIIREYLLLNPDAENVNHIDKEEIIVTLPNGFKLLSDCTPKDYKYDEAISYLKKRNINSDIIKEFNIGYITKCDLHNRIIIPSYDSFGDLNYYVARWFSQKPNELKYINPSAEKEKIIFGESKINFDSTIYLVEGAFDHIVVPNSVALLGKYISDEFMDILHDNANAYIVILLDDDAYYDAMLLYRKLNFGRLKGRIRIIRPRKGYDPSKIFEEFGAKGITNLLRSAYTLPEY